MQQGERFQLTHSSLAVAMRDGKNVSFTVPEGTIVEIINGPFNGTRMINVKINHEMVMMSADLREHIKRVKGGAAGFSAQPSLRLLYETMFRSKN
jgi:hypothetical protein